MNEAEEFLNGKKTYAQIFIENFNKSDFRNRVLEIAKNEGFLNEIPYKGDLSEIPILGRDSDDAISSVRLEENNRYVKELTISQQVLNGDYLLQLTDNDRLVFDAICAHEAVHLWQITEADYPVERSDIRHTIVNGGFYDQMIDFLFGLGWKKNDDGFILVVSNDVRIHAGEEALDWLFGKQGFSDVRPLLEPQT